MKNSWTALESFVEFLLARCAVVSVSFLDMRNFYYFVRLRYTCRLGKS